MNLAKPHLGDEADHRPEELTDLVVRGYSPIGTLMGMNFGSAQIEAREGLIPGRQIATQSVRVEMSTGGDYPQTGSAAINYDNVDRFIAVLETLEFTTIKTDRFKFTEVEFELDGLKVIVFNNEGSNLFWALSAEGVSVHFNSLVKLGELKTIIARAKAHLDQSGMPGR